MLNQMAGAGSKPDTLQCRVQINQPFLDFAFRFEAGYIVKCPMAQFRGEEAGLQAFLRIKPEGANPVYLGDRFKVPALPENMRLNYRWNHLNQDAEFAGVFCGGRGHYGVELVIVDNARRVFRKHWNVKIEPTRNELRAELAMPNNTIDSAVLPLWQHSRFAVKARGGGPQLTVLLDAAPVAPASQRLRAWDRAFLVSSFHSLLRGLQPSSVRLIVFNLEQQRELFRAESFGRDQFPELSKALRGLELGSIDYRRLGSHEDGSNLLSDLINGEARNDQSADAIVFLGPNLRKMEKLPNDSLTPCDSLQSRVSYLEYFPIPGYESPDSIHYATNACHGNVYKLHSPVDLADAISKLQAQMTASRKPVVTAGTF